MSLNPIEIVTHLVPIRYAMLNTVEVPLSELCDLCDDLSEVDGRTNALLIKDQQQKSALEDLGVIKTNIRGGSYPGPNFNEFYKMVTEAWDSIDK